VADLASFLDNTLSAGDFGETIGDHGGMQVAGL
jgi:hypothetical protein